MLLHGAAQAVGVPLLTCPVGGNGQCLLGSGAHIHGRDVGAGTILSAQKWGQGSDSREGAAFVLLWPEMKDDGAGRGARLVPVLSLSFSHTALRQSFPALGCSVINKLWVDAQGLCFHSA